MPANIFLFDSWELLHLLRKALPGMLLFAAFRPFSEMNLKHNIALKTVPGTLKMNMGRLTATQVHGSHRTKEFFLLSFSFKDGNRTGNVA